MSESRTNCVVDQANTEAVRRIVSAKPYLVDVRPAGEVIAGLSDRDFLHAGPPLTGWHAVEGALRGADTRFEEAAATLGAGRWTAFTHVTLPLVAPGIAAGGVLCWARALGEFGATITFAGNYPGITQTMPLAVYQTMEGGDLAGAVVLSLILLVVSVTILAALRDKWITSA